ncbi:MAG: right-handed parallel beta-helix repeat-containing protein [Clostridiales bacterium]|jgi:hypothetical protein|nr:right-handed parallel beta-helix repeat-containing protein [Clostridiales bacterium]
MTFEVGEGKQFSNIQDALDASRSLSGDREIAVFPGVYSISPICLTKKDKGLKLAAYGCVLLSGGVSSKLSKSENGLFSAPANSDVRLLAVNGSLRPRSRYPEQGFINHLQEFRSNWLSTSQGGWDKGPTKEELEEIRLDPKAFPPDFDFSNTEICVRHRWDASLAKISVSGFLAKTAEPLACPAGAFGVAQCAIFNSKSMPKGSWRLENGQVFVKPYDLESLEGASVQFPALDSLISFEPGASDISISGFSFEMCGAPLVNELFGAGGVSGAISCESGITNCSFENLSFKNLAGWAIKLKGDNKDVKVQGCHIEGAGAGGILLESQGSCSIQGNTIQNIGLINISAVGIMASNCLISGNTLKDLPYSGIVATGKSTVTSNTVNRAMQTLNDGAGVYATFGNDGLVKDNTVMFISSSSSVEQRHGLYLDEKCSGWTVEGNRVSDCDSAILCHMSEGNAIRGNWFSGKTPISISFPRCVGYEVTGNHFSAPELSIECPRHAISLWKENDLSLDKPPVWVELDDYERKPGVEFRAEKI